MANAGCFCRWSRAARVRVFGSQGGQQLVGPCRGQLGRGAQFAPVVAQVLDVGRVVVLDGFEEAVEPLLACGAVHWCLADDGRQFPYCRIGGVAQRARGAGDLAQCRRELLEEQDGTLRGLRRVPLQCCADLGQGAVDALDGQLRSVPAEGGAAEPGSECPGVHEQGWVVRVARRRVARRLARLPRSGSGRRWPGVRAAGPARAPSARCCAAWCAGLIRDARVLKGVSPSAEATRCRREAQPRIASK